MTRAWFLLSLAGAVIGVALGACHDSKPSGESNSNWLRMCSGDTHCGDSERCVCGVCTVLCVDDGECQRDDGPEASCVEVGADRCGGAHALPICVASCEQTADCGDELSCVEGSCLGATQALDGGLVAEVGDAEVDGAVDGDAQVDGAVDAAAALADLDQPCDEATACRAGLGCERGTCKRPYAGPGCDAAATNRPACGANGCEDGLVCHVDGTCIEPGTCDAFGETTLAEVGDIRALVLDPTHVYLLDWGSVDALGNHRGDGAIERVPLDAGPIELVVGGLSYPTEMLLDVERVLWRSTFAYDRFWWTDKDGGGTPTEIVWADPQGGVESFQWSHDASHVYYARAIARDAVEIDAVDKTTTTVTKLAERATFEGRVWPLRADGEAVFVFALPDVLSLAASGGAFSPVGMLQVADLSWDDFAVGEHAIFAAGESGAVSIARVDGARTKLATLGASEFGVRIQPYRDHVYFASKDIRTGHVEIRRAPLQPGNSEDLVAFDGSSPGIASGEVPFAVSDAGLFFVQDGRLVRHVLADLSSPSGPAQGSDGGPCFGDLGCDAGLGCFGGTCLPLPWSGPGCEPSRVLRDDCSQGQSCPAGELCHVDGTCIEPGTCDAQGRSTLAAVGDLRDLQLDSTHVYLVDWGTEDALGNQQGDGAILRVPQAAGATEVVVSDLDRPYDLLVDDSRVFWTTLVGNGRSLWVADKADGGNAAQIAATPNYVTWTHDPTHLYFATQDDTRSEIFRIQKGTSVVEPLTNDDWSDTPELAVDSQRIFAYGGGASYTVPLAGGTRTKLADGPANIDDITLGPSDLLIADDTGASLQSLPKAGGNYRQLATFPELGGALLLSVHRDRLYYSYAEGALRAIQRLPVAGGAIETLASMAGPANGSGTRDILFGVSDQGLFFVQQGRLVRQVLLDYQPAPSPAQGASGGPCQPDLSCDSALQCLDTTCQ